MRLQILIVLMTLTALATLGFPKDQKQGWQSGKLTNVQEGSPQNIAVITGNQYSLAGGYSQCKNWLYLVETETMTYVFSAHTGAWCADHPRPFTIGSQVKFMLGSKGKAVLVDEEGKEFKTSLIKKATNEASH